MASFMETIEKIIKDILDFFVRIFNHMKCHSKCCEKYECDCGYDETQRINDSIHEYQYNQTDDS